MYMSEFYVKNYTALAEVFSHFGQYMIWDKTLFYFLCGIFMENVTNNTFKKLKTIHS